MGLNTGTRQQRQHAKALERKAWQDAGCQGPYAIDDAVDGLHSLILPAKPADPILDAAMELTHQRGWEADNPDRPMVKFAKAAIERGIAIERAGGTISFEGEAGVANKP